MNRPPCKLCHREAMTRGYCGPHYKRALLTGEIEPIRKRRKTQIAQPPVDLVELHRKNEITQAINWGAA